MNKIFRNGIVLPVALGTLLATVLAIVVACRGRHGAQAGGEQRAQCDREHDAVAKNLVHGGGPSLRQAERLLHGHYT